MRSQEVAPGTTAEQLVEEAGVILPRQAPPVQRDRRTYGGPPRRSTVGLCNDSAVTIVAAVYGGLETLRPRDLVQGSCPYVSRKTRIGGPDD